MKKQREVLLNQLCVLIGESPENGKELQRTSLDSINYDNTIPEYISSEVITQRPDYLKAENSVEKAGIDVIVETNSFSDYMKANGLNYNDSYLVSANNKHSWRRSV